MTTTPPHPQTTDPLVALCPSLRAAFLRHDYTLDALTGSLGPAGVSALGRSDAASVRRLARGMGATGVLLRLFVLGDRVHEARVAEVLEGVDVDSAIAAGLLIRDGEHLRALVDLRPTDLGHGNRWVFSDVDGSMVRTPTRPDHVLGIGQASLSLLSITPSSRVDTVLDLGTGCGVQLLAAADNADRLTGTDITPRCLSLTAATLAINGVEAELLRGPWFEPVGGRRFDRIVSNPPFVIGTPEVSHSYRESGLVLDGASRTVVSGAVDHLAPDGTAIMLCSWVEQHDHDWRSRLASWVPAEGVDAWILRRDVSDPELYVWTWLTDEGMDPRDPETVAAAERWLDHLASHDVTGIGFGYVYLRRMDGPSSVLCEDLTHPFDGGLGDEAEAYFARNRWLRRRCREHGSEAEALDSAILTVAPDTHLHESVRMSAAAVAALDPDREPASPTLVVERTTGARWRHEIDATIATLLRGLAAGALPLVDVVALTAAAHGIPGDELLQPARAVVADLLRHGVVVPVDEPGSVTPAARLAAERTR